MPRIIIVADRGKRSTTAPVFFDEDVTLNLLEDAHASEQILERMAWALSDAERVESIARPAA
jgi:hypothetical protein